MRDVFTYTLTAVVESGAARSWSSPITNSPTKQNPSPSSLEMERGGGWVKGMQQMGGRGKGRDPAKEGRRGRENHRKMREEGGEWDNSEKQTLASAILRDRGTQK